MGIGMAPTSDRVNTTEIPSRTSWKQELAPYLEVDRRRSLGQIASVVLPYLASTASTTRTPAISTTAAWARSTR